eukprot:TRINITY_DN104677_c0_g1_i1.p1 TRINITY_DN104677_c0_g1~~TRINITY_DN104677_c0_g1_i1.p1  ORF type:complete len:218 (-),score=21.38 TRINITY_DN104677_c0_g1_i1:47-700(-)
MSDEQPWNTIEIGTGCDPQPTSSSLPGLVTADFEQMSGPATFCNWVIPGRFLIGSVPGCADDVLTLVENNVNSVACLLENLPSAYSEAHTAIQDAGRSLTIFHFPMPDFGVGSNDDTNAFLSELETKLKEGQTVLYIHCRGGHGRTGVMAILLLQRLYGLSLETAKGLVAKYHAHRKYCGRWGCSLPETQQQDDQIMALQQCSSKKKRRNNKHKWTG